MKYKDKRGYITTITSDFFDCDPIDYENDCNKIIAVCKQHGLEIDLQEARCIWEDYSNYYWDANWLAINNYSCQEIWDIIVDFILRRATNIRKDD